MQAAHSLLRHQTLIAGNWVDGNRTLPVVDPATGETIGEVPRTTSADLALAVQGACEVFPEWRGTLAQERARVLRRIRGLLLENQEELADIITLEQGKPKKEAQAEVRYAAGYFEWFGEEAKRIYGSTIPSPFSETRILVEREPVGVCVGITPWNFPCAMIARKLSAALSAGCPMLIKPAEATPLSALALATLCDNAGLLPGLLSVLTGTREDAERIGKELIADSRVRKVSFTGSTVVGKRLLAASASQIKRVSLELGGNAPFLVLDDADLDAAVRGALIAKFRNAGQTCVAANRFYVHAGVYDRFLDSLTEAARSLRVGIGRDPCTDLGPLINQVACDKVERHLQDALAKGAKLTLAGGRLSRGTFFHPIVLGNVAPDSLLCREETFGPLAGIVRVSSDSEAIELANDSPAGLVAYVYSQDHSRIVRVTDALESGMIGVNTGLVSTEVAPFGGIKESGLGREGSRYGLDDYLEYKYLCLGGLGGG